MWDLIDNMSDRLGRSRAALVAGHDSVVIRLARDDDTPQLHDLAALDSAPPLTGQVLMALVDGRPWAALALEENRVIADPFRPSAAAVELLALRVDQLRAAGRAPRLARAARLAQPH